MENLLDRIVINPEIMTGKPIIKGTRLTVQYIIHLLAQDISQEEILREYPGLVKDDILACLHFSEKILNAEVFLPL
jgi:uncharacterized protein (DUF433 family)